MIRRRGYNMVEILIALLIVGIITITLMSFINDYTERYRLTIARNDLNRIAQAIQLAEESLDERVRTLSLPGGRPTTQLAPFLVELPTRDPWEHQFVKDGQQIVDIRDSPDPQAVGQPYIIDEGVGRIMCAGPDGQFTTRLGQDPADNDRDIIVNYRVQPWVAYMNQGTLWAVSADGASQKRITTGTWENVSISTDGSTFAGIGPDGANELWVGTVDAQQQALKKVLPRNTPTEPFSSLSGSSSMFPIWFPRGGSVIFIAANDIFRYDYGIDRVFRLTKGGVLSGGDVAGQQHFIYNDGTVSIYRYTTSGGHKHSLTIGTDGRIAYNRRDTGLASGIHLVSASGQDSKLLKRENEDGTAWLPVTWLGTDVIVYMTDPATASQRYFYRVDQNGGQDIPLHQEPIAAPILNPTPSRDARFIAFFLNEQSGGVVKTDGSGFVEESEGELTAWSVSSGNANLAVPPVWLKDSSTLYFAMADGSGGEIRTLSIRNEEVVVETARVLGSGETHDGFIGFRPEAMALTDNETLMAAVSSLPPAVFVIPLLGPAGARTQATIPPLGVGETPAMTWLGQ